jgi:hypothetical protein
MVEFPETPTLGQKYVADNAVTYTWLGNRWSSATAINAGTAEYYRDGGRANTEYFADTLDGGTA